MRSAFALFLAAFLLAVVTLLARGQQRPPGPEQGGPFAICGVAEGAVLLDTRSGNTWLLARSADRLQSAVWLPALRIDNLEEAGEWRQTEQRRSYVARARDELEQRRLELQRLHEQLKAVAVGNASHPRIQEVEKKIAEVDAQLKELK